MWLKCKSTGEITQVVSVKDGYITHLNSKAGGETDANFVEEHYEVIHTKPAGFVFEAKKSGLDLTAWLPIELADKSAEHVLVNDTNSGLPPWTSARYIDGEDWSGWAYSDETMSDVNPEGPKPTHFLIVPAITGGNHSIVAHKPKVKYSSHTEEQTEFERMCFYLFQVMDYLIENGLEATTELIVGHYYWVDVVDHKYVLKFSPDGRSDGLGGMEIEDIHGIGADDMKVVSRGLMEWLKDPAYL